MSDTLAVNGAVTPTAPPKIAGNSDIRITIKRSQHRIDLDMDKLTWKDGKELRRHQAAIASGEMTEEEAIGLMDGIIEKVAGQHPDSMPMEVVNKIVAVLFADDADAVASEGN